MNPVTETVIVKLSSQPEPMDREIDRAMLLFGAQLTVLLWGGTLPLVVQSSRRTPRMHSRRRCGGLPRWPRARFGA